MSLPNPTSLLRCLPSGLRVTVARGDVVGSLAVRTNDTDTGSISLGGIECDSRCWLHTLVADFNPRLRIGDVLTVDAAPATGTVTWAFVLNVGPNTGNLIQRCQVVLLDDLVTIGESDPIPCHLGLLAQDVLDSLGGFRPDDTQGFFIPEVLLPDGYEDLPEATPVTIHDETFEVARVSRSARHEVLCVTCQRRGAAS